MMIALIRLIAKKLNTLAVFTCLSLPLSLGIISLSHAKDLGFYGETFSITETNLLDLIQKRLLAMEASGELAQWEHDVKERVKQSMLRPSGYHLMTTSTPDTFYHVPLLVLQADVTDIDGKLLYPKGTTVNPLDTRTYPDHLKPLYQKQQPFYDTTLIMINGDDADQLRWTKAAVDVLKQQNKNVKVILINGNVHESSKLLGLNVRFDYGRFISNSLKLKAVPSVITQDDHNPTRLKIVEVGTHQLMIKGGSDGEH
ncbi:MULTISPECIES: hypothetical protein [Cysteiniphilum]|uniref:hypothetical protein n=1 Tax=Cysteiniphilum TaxID=2056696 RepID=UPI001780922A|nr:MULTISPECIES: hypothetical protein [Cysteiniphilum]